MAKPDLMAERAVLAGIYKYGSDAYIDVADILSADTFSKDSHGVFYRCFETAIKSTDKLDIPSVLGAAGSLGLSEFMEKPAEQKLLRAISNFPVELSNVRTFAAKIRKIQIGKLLEQQLLKAGKTVADITGDEPITHIIGIAENAIFDFSKQIRDFGEYSTELMGDSLEEYIEHLAANPTSSIGIPTGLPQYDKSIGGGLRLGTVSLIGARPKQGKSQLANNVAYHIACNLGIPVLYLDTEMSKDIHQHRMLANVTNVTVDNIESGNFPLDIVKAASGRIKTAPYHYKQIVGLPFEDVLTIMRRWRARYVKEGQPCVIIYDYIKLMSSEGMTKDLKEYQLLGFMMTSLHNFMAKYNVACLSFIQLNRDGIDKEDTSTASGSDRLIWLCTNFSVFKKKVPTELAQEKQDGITKGGNRKLVPIVTRFGAGLEDGDYICLQSQYQYGRIVEVGTRLSLMQGGHSGDFKTDNSDNGTTF